MKTHSVNWIERGGTMSPRHLARYGTRHSLPRVLTLCVFLLAMSACGGGSSSGTGSGGGSGGGGAGASDTQIYVTDLNNRIARFDDMTGANWTGFGASGSGANQFNTPKGLTVDPNGRIYVVDSANSRIA